MIDVRPVVQILGWIVLMVGVVMAIPIATDYLEHDTEWLWFSSTSASAGFVGVLLILGTHSAERLDLTLRQAFLVTALGWIAVALVGALPFLSMDVSLTDAVFESMSAITTTGSTVLTGLDTLADGILLWRALLQWFGGVGILALAILVLPLLRVGGMQLFRIESSDSSDLRVFTVFRTVTVLAGLYIGMTVVCAALYAEFGMGGFDALTHAMTTVSTGGFSTHDTSFGYFNSLPLLWIATVFMVGGSLPFLLYAKATTGAWRPLVTDSQVRGFLIFLALVGLGLGLWLQDQRDMPFWDALGLATFSVTSVVTTTGFVAGDYTEWGPGAVGVFLVLMFVGGCSGSTSGAIKVYRFQVLFLVVRAHVTHLFSPHRVVPIKYNGQALPPDVPTSVLAFLAVFIATIGLFTIMLTFMGLDLVTAYSASVTAICNVGPGLGDVVGPSGTFQTLPDASKWLLIAAMLAGRLEVLPLLVLFNAAFWRP